MQARTQFLYRISKLFDFAERNKIEVDCFVFYRDPAQQLQEFLKGKSKIKSDGPHQHWLAMDIAIVENNDLLFGSDDLTIAKYKILGDYWKSLGENCIWGGDFKFANDVYHFELKSK